MSRLGKVTLNRFDKAFMADAADTCHEEHDHHKDDGNFAQNRTTHNAAAPRKRVVQRRNIVLPPGLSTTFLKGRNRLILLDFQAEPGD